MLNMNKVIPFMLLFFFISGSFITAFGSVLVASELVENSWSTKTAMNDPRSELGVVALDGKIYAISGAPLVDKQNVKGQGFVGTTECYDPVTDTWTTLKPMPTPRGNFIIVTCQGKIYCIGGANGTIYPLGPPIRYPLDIVEVYDPVTDMWESKTSFTNLCKTGLQAQVVNKQIFIITLDGELYLYNPLTDKWSTKTPLTNQEEPLQTHVVNEQLFVITQSAMYMYNPATDTWINKTNMPTAMTYAFSDVMDNQIVVGDFLLTPSTETLWMGLFNAQLRIRIYDPISNTWHDGKTTDEHIFATNPIFNAATMIMTSGGYAPKNVYVLGIEAAKEDLFNVKPFTWVYDPIGDSWSTAKAMDTAPYIRGCKMVVIDDVFYTLGGEFNVKYIPVAYNPQGYPDTQPSATEDITSSRVPSEPTLLGSFLTGPVVVIIVLTVSGVIVASLFFYLRRK